MNNKNNRNWIKRIWYDPVWSSVIAGVLLVIPSLIYGYIVGYKYFFLSVTKHLASNVSIPYFVFYILILMACTIVIILVRVGYSRYRTKVPEEALTVLKLTSDRPGIDKFKLGHLTGKKVQNTEYYIDILYEKKMISPVIGTETTQYNVTKIGRAYLVSKKEI